MAEPYYSDDLVTLYLGDCREVTEWLAADVLVTDPPYGTADSHTYGADGYGRRRLNEPGRRRINQSIEGDDSTLVRDSALEAWGDRPACLFGSPRRADPPISVADRLVWDKKRPGINGGPWRVDNAAVSVFSVFPDQSEHIWGSGCVAGAAPARIAGLSACRANAGGRDA